MTDEYIRRQEMLDAVDHLHIIPSIDGTGKPTPTDDFRVQFLGTVLRVPSADVVQVVHGRWMPQKGGGLCCSECGRYALDEPDGNFIHVSVPSKFCHNCGAKMDGERKE